ncbi:FAD-binding protein [Catellatospora methionotrophica]|uniref:FAD-binding protein n=1 Tax=Catellatospora methionotrophica TaxID=121620 RepID=UPI0033F742B0
MNDVFDAVVIGGGPAGLFAAWSLAAGGAKVMLVEAGNGMRQSLCPRVSARMRGQSVREAEKFRLQCDRCVCLTGLGGAAFHFDTNLGYVNGLSRTKVERDASGRVTPFSGLERALGSFDRAHRAVDHVYSLMYSFGLTPARAEVVDAVPSFASMGSFLVADEGPSQAITVDEALTVVDALLHDALGRGLGLALQHRVENVTEAPGGAWRLHISGGEVESLVTRNVVFAVGKLGLPWVKKMLVSLNIEHRASATVDVGVRLEMPRLGAKPLTASCHNPKLTFLNAQSEPVRTFCVCEGGRIMQYNLEDVVLLDGQHCLTTPTQRTNFGIVTTLNVPEGRDGADVGLEYARSVSRAGGGYPVAQPLRELLGMAGGTTASSSLIRATHANLADVIGPARVADIRGMVERLAEQVPDITGPETIVAAPVVEKMFPKIELSADMSSSREGIYFAGDCSSKIIGVTYGAATGIACAEGILKADKG